VEKLLCARELRWFARLPQQETVPAGCSKSPSSKAAASEDPEAYPLGYVEDLNDARTLLADFFSILPNQPNREEEVWRKPLMSMPTNFSSTLVRLGAR
jgi:hypothetical protein